MSADYLNGEVLYSGAKGYVWLRRIDAGTRHGALMFYANPDAQKMHAIDVDGMLEMEEAVGVVEGLTGELDFLIMHGAYDPIHAGADITQFHGDCDYEAIARHLKRGTNLDVRVKALWPKLRTISVMCGDRYGGSVEWPLYSEWSVCDKYTKLQFSEVHLGIIPGWNGVLNVLLKSNSLNANYMGQTGNAVTAGELFKAGLVQQMADVPAPPDRRSVPREEWSAVWSEHAAECQRLLIDCALQVAADEATPERRREYTFCTADDLAAEVTRRLDRAPYAALQDEVKAKVARIDLNDREAVKGLNRETMKKIMELTKPLAPESVDAVAGFVDTWGGMSPDEVLADYAKAAAHEEQLCESLMHTTNRRIGINAVLSKNPVERVAVFE